MDNVIGKSYGRLVVVAELNRTAGRKRVVLVECDCGTEKAVLLGNLRRKLTTSCGCLLSELTVNRNFRHGLRYHRLYSVWCSMKQRCLNPNCAGYKNYGGRGISICDEWTASYQTFHEWAIANGWAEGTEIDRTDNNGDYTPSNCRFVTDCENSRNRRNSKLTKENVQRIHELRTSGMTLRRIGAEFGVTEAAVSAIVRGKLWKNIKKEAQHGNSRP